MISIRARPRSGVKRIERMEKRATDMAKGSRRAPTECWVRRGDAIVDEVNGRTSVDFIVALKNQSDNAWVAVKTIVFNPVLRGKAVRARMDELGYRPAKVFSDFVNHMVVDGALDRIRNPDKLVAFLQKSIRNQVIYDTARSKKEKTQGKKTVFIDDHFSNPSDVNSKETVNPIDKIPEDEETVAAREDRLMEDEKAIVRRCFVELWKKHPRQAIVLCLRNMGLSALEIKELIGETTDNNVSQLARRGGLDFADLIRAKKVPMPGVSFKGRVGSRRQKHG